MAKKHRTRATAARATLTATQKEELIQQRAENRDLRTRMGEAERLRHVALEAASKMETALEAIAQIADCRSQHARDEWSLVEDVARNAIRKAAL